MKKAIKRKNRTFGVSDHALLRWLERVHDIDIEWLREAFETQIEDHHKPGVRTVFLDDMVYYFSEEDVLLTVVPNTILKSVRSAPARYRK